MMNWIRAISKTMEALLLTGVGNIMIALSLIMIIFICISVLAIFIFHDVFSKPESIENPDESLLILHVVDKYNTADVTFSDLVGCLKEKGFSIEEYFAIRRISFERTEKNSNEYHSIFEKVEKLMRQESTAQRKKQEEKYV